MENIMKLNMRSQDAPYGERGTVTKCGGIESGHNFEFSCKSFFFFSVIEKSSLVKVVF